MELLTRLWRRHRRDLGAFGAVGALAFVVDVGLFNLLRFGWALGLGSGTGVLDDQPITAKVVSASVATVVAWAGNRWWTFRHRNRPAVLRELALFVVMNAAALVIGVLVLATSHYVLGLRGPLPDNAANLLGIALGTAFRYVAYRLWVFRRPPPTAPSAPSAAGLPVVVGGPQEDREDGRALPQQLQPTPLRGDEVTRQR